MATPNGCCNLASIPFPSLSPYANKFYKYQHIFFISYTSKQRKTCTVHLRRFVCLLYRLQVWQTFFFKTNHSINLKKKWQQKKDIQVLACVHRITNGFPLAIILEK